MVDVALAVERHALPDLLQMLEDEYDALHEAVFLPALDALAPLG